MSISPYIDIYTTGNKFATMITGSGLIINSDYVTADWYIFGHRYHNDNALIK